MQEQIESEPQHSFDILSIDFKKEDGGKSIQDDVIDILCSFSTHLQFPEAVDLLLQYYQKRPDLFEQVYHAFVSRFEIDIDSYRYGYYTQRIVVEKLCALAENVPTTENSLLFVRVAEHYLKFDYSKAEGGRHNSITYYTLHMLPHEPVISYRKALLHQLTQMYKAGRACAEIEGFLFDYCRNISKESYETAQKEFDCVLEFFTLFSTDNLYHCAIARHIKDVADRIKSEYNDRLSPYLKAPKYKIFYALKPNRKEDLMPDYDAGVAHHKERVKKLVCHYDLSQCQGLLDVCKECLSTMDKDGRLLSAGVGYVFEALVENESLYIDMVKIYLQADTPYDIYPSDIVERLFGIMPPDKVYELISGLDYTQKNTWLWCFYSELPQDKVTVRWANALLEYLDSPPMQLRSSPHRRLEALQKYEIVDADIIVKACKLLAQHYEESPFVFIL